MATLREHQFELTWPGGTSSFVFGTLDTGYQTLTPPQISAENGEDGDVTGGREDGRVFGTDFRGAKKISFEIGVHAGMNAAVAARHRTNRDAVELMDAIWDDPAFRNGPRALGVLRYRIAGRTLRAYGRPRNFAAASDAWAEQAYTPVTAEFHMRDASWYDDVEQVESISLIQNKLPGLIGPLTTPLSTAEVTSASGAITVGGRVRTWPVVTFYGPVSNPALTIGTQIRIALTKSIPEGARVTYDPRPWARTVLRNDGANYAGALTQNSTPLKRCLLQPGVRDMKYTGLDATGTSYAQVAWRAAYARP